MDMALIFIGVPRYVIDFSVIFKDLGLILMDLFR